MQKNEDTFLLEDIVKQLEFKGLKLVYWDFKEGNFYFVFDNGKYLLLYKNSKLITKKRKTKRGLNAMIKRINKLKKGDRSGRKKNKMRKSVLG